MITARAERMSDFFTKHHLDGLPFPAVLHHFTAADGGDPHDHPWPFRSFILSGGYIEQVYAPNGTGMVYQRRPGDSIVVPAHRIHRITHLPDGECWTLIMPLGPKEREPGFYQFRADGVWHRLWCQPEFARLGSHKEA